MEEGSIRNRRVIPRIGISSLRQVSLQSKWHGKKRNAKFFAILFTFGFYLMVVHLIRVHIVKPKFRKRVDKVKRAKVPSNIKASVIIMNYGRPELLKTSRLLPTLTQHKNIDEIFLLHANKKTKFHYDHEKVTNIDAVKENDTLGLSMRFHFCDKLVAKNDWVFMIDDDMEFPPESVTFLLSEFMVDSKRIIGKWGRDLNKGALSLFSDGYNTVERDGVCEVVLTKFMLMEQSICKAFGEHKGIVEDSVIRYSKPYWNGEDIFMSLVANHVYGYEKKREYRNRAYPHLNVFDVNDLEKESGISGSHSGFRPWSSKWWSTLNNHLVHKSYRGQFWNAARNELRRTKNKKGQRKN